VLKFINFIAGVGIGVKELAQQLEEAREARDSQQGLIAELRYELSQSKEEEETLKSRVEKAVAEAEEKKVRSQLMESRLQKMSAENEDLTLKGRQLVEDLAALKEQIERWEWRKFANGLSGMYTERGKGRSGAYWDFSPRPQE